MGSEQSVPNRASVSSDITSPTSASRQFDPLLALADSRGRMDSIASDLESTAEVPYVSYTVNKPIGSGNSPKKSKSALAGIKSGSKISRLKFATGMASSKLDKSVHNTMVLVGGGNSSSEDTESFANDPELVRLKEIPSFLPIMRASLSGSSAKDPDILERLDYRGLLSLTQRYEDHLRSCAITVATEQTELNKKIHKADKDIAAVTQALAERHKKMSKYAEKLSRVGEMSKCLSKCHMLLNENLEQLEVLNALLPSEERLEPFVWTTG